MRPPLALALAALLLLEAPDTQSVVVTRVFPQPGQIGLFIADADGSAERPLVAPADIDYDAEWSRDGKSIVFTSERNGSADLYRVNADGSGLERLTDSPAYDDQAAFSPNGKRSEEHTSELQSPDHLVCRLLLEKKNRVGNPRRAITTYLQGSQLP